MNKNNNNKIIFLIALTLIIPFNISATLVGNTNNAVLGLSSGTTVPFEVGRFRTGTSFSLDLYVNTAGQEVNAVAAYINYNPSLFSVENIDYTGSLFPLQWEHSTSSGKIVIGRTVSGANTVNSTHAKIATITLKGLADTSPSSDNFTFDFSPGDTTKSAVFLGGSQGGTYILSGVYNAKISLDSTPPPNVSNFTATAGDSQISLRWRNPASSDFAGVIILRKTGSYPANVSDGTVVYNGNGTSHVDAGLTNGTTYYYKAFSRDAVNNYSSGVQTSATPRAITPPPTPRDITPPGQITTLTATALTSREIRLNWIAVGDDGNVGTASSYDIRYSTAVITSANFSSANKVSNPPTPKINGSSETFTISGLSGDTTYYFAIKAIDKSGNSSPLSNVVSAKTYKIADLNYNGVVNMQDASILMSYWGRTDKPVADLNQDGYVNMQDANIMMAQWDKFCCKK
jgi:chitodextrinase